MTAFRPVPATGFMPLAAVFDLDHTLIAGDATIGWTEYLYERGVVTDPVFREINERMKASYHAGTLDIAAWLREAVPAYSGLDEAERNALVSDFIEEKIRPIAYPQGFETIRAAKAAGMLTLIISASNAFFVKPIAERVFGVDVALGTELVVRNGRITPELSGTPTFREGRSCAFAPHSSTGGCAPPRRSSTPTAATTCRSRSPRATAWRSTPTPCCSRPLARTDGW